MSAFILGKEHINYLIEAARSRTLNPNSRFQWFHNGWHEIESPSAAGQMLWDENIKSVHARYPDDELDQLPGPIGETFVFQYSHCYSRRIDPVQVLKACSCYEYQTCEHEEWEASEAKAFIDSLKSDAIHALPGWEEAQWEIEAA